MLRTQNTSIYRKFSEISLIIDKERKMSPFLWFVFALEPHQAVLSLTPDSEPKDHT